MPDASERTEDQRPPVAGAEAIAEEGAGGAVTPARQKKRSKAGLIFAEAFAVILFVVLALAGVAVWSMKSGPVDISFANDYIESALRQDENGVYTTMNSAALHWPDLQGPLLLQIKGVRVFSAKGKEIVFVEEIGLALSKPRLMIGQIEPVSLIVNNPSLRVIRSEDNDLDFGFGTPETIVDEKIVEQADEQKDLVGELLALIENPEDPRAKRSPMSSLKSLEINSAQVMVEDHKLGASWFIPDFDIMFTKAERGLSAIFKIGFPAVNEENSSIMAEVIIDRGNRDINVAAMVENFDLRIVSGKVDALAVLAGQNIVLNGTLSASLDQYLTLKSADASFFSVSGEIENEQLSEQPIPYQNFEAVLHYFNDDGAETLQLEKFQIRAKDVTVRGDAHLTGAQSRDEVLGGEIFDVNGYKGSLSLSIDDMPHSGIAPLWPVFLQDDSSREWIVDKMSGGSLSGLKADAQIAAFKHEDEWEFDLHNLIAAFTVADMTVDYRNPLPAVKKGYGSGVFDLEQDKILIDIKQADLGGMNVTSAQLEFRDVVKEGQGSVGMAITLDGPLRNVFEYISTEPIDLKDELDMDIAQVKGHAALEVNLDFPTSDDLKIEEIRMDIKGKVTEGYLPAIVKGLPLSGGPYDVAVNNEFYAVKGSGQLDGRAVTLDWKEYLDSAGKEFRHQAKAQIVVDEALRQSFGIDLSEFVAGDLPADIIYTGLQGSAAEAQVKVDVTPAKVFLKPFDYEKQIGVSGEVSLKARLENDNLRSITDMNGSAPQFKLENTTLGFAGDGADTRIAKANIGRAIIGETISSGTIDIDASGKMQIAIKGEFFDLRPFLDKDEDDLDKPYDSPPMVIALAADQMRTADGQSIQYAKIYADIDDQGRFNQLELDATAGKGDIYLRFKPDARGVRTFRLEAEDAGATLKAFDVYPNIIGGKLVIYGEPIKGVFDRNLKGLAEITNFKVVKAPSLARLVGALSLPGVMQLLNSDGLSFEKLESNFDWVYRPDGSLLVLKDGRTSGNSLGLTFDGTFDNAKQTVDVSGTIIPLSGINKVIGSIPLVGDILTGGTGAVFAATYTMRGSFEDADTSVNPLSVLTPGILRRILFE